ncbi:MAG: radical SAM protein [Candidatus Bathyarchaeia archaeon]
MEILSETKSLCPFCLNSIPARIVTDGKRVYMKKNCGEHGAIIALLWSDLNLYKRSLKFSRVGKKPNEVYIKETEKGCPFDCGLCPSHRQHTCLAIFEVTDGCNLLCPVCLADSQEKPSWNPSMWEIEEILKNLLRFEGRPTAIQFSGGEPTIRNDLVEIVGLARDLGFKLIEIDTNGIEIARNPTLAKDLADNEISGVYLQFDGLTPEVYRAIRGRDLIKIKEKAIENCRKAGLSVTLAVTLIRGINDSQVWDIIKYAIKRRVIGVNFQPFAALGRYPQGIFDPMNRVTISDVQMSVEEGSGGKIRSTDFIPVPCPDPRCSSLLYAYFKEGEDLYVLTKLVDIEDLINKYSLTNRFVDFDDILKAISDELNLSREFARNLRPQSAGSSLRILLEYLRPEGFFSVGCHFAQDAWTVDLERLSKCCVHEIRENGRLIPFCLYNITSVNKKKLYRSIF